MGKIPSKFLSDSQEVNQIQNIKFQNLTEAFFPYLKQKQAASGPQNGAVGPKSCRRRWGQTLVKAMDSWEDLDDTEFGMSCSKKPSIALLKEKKNKECLFR